MSKINFSFEKKGGRLFKLFYTITIFSLVFNMSYMGVFFSTLDASADTENGRPEKVTICHVNASGTWNEQSVSQSSLSGHFDAQGNPLHCVEGDTFCDYMGVCVASTEVCDDGVDNDLDGDVDGNDEDCSTACDDADNDGVCDADDVCQGYDDNADSDQDMIPDACDVCDGYDDNNDADNDKIPDECDNCVTNANTNQLDSDDDGIGDVCEDGVECMADDDCGTGTVCSDGQCIDWPPAEVCDDELDNDMDQMIDCMDSDCFDSDICQEEEEEDPAYCGDGIINQEWEECDGKYSPNGFPCTDQCQLYSEECSDKVFARVNIDDVKNDDNGDMSSRVYLGSSTYFVPSGTWFLVSDGGVAIEDADISNYEDVPGLAVQRLDGSIRSVLYGTRKGKEIMEHVDGRIEFFNATVVDQRDDTSKDKPGNNKLEKGFDGNGVDKYNAGDDEVWMEEGDMTNSYFWLTTTTADDGFYTDWTIVDDCVVECGDYKLEEEGEECDDGPDGSETCTSDCTLIKFCEEGSVEIINPSFETPVLQGWDLFDTSQVGWNLSWVSGDTSEALLEIHNGVKPVWYPSHEDQYAELDTTAPVEISQDVETFVGAMYRLSYDFSARTEVVDNVLNVLVDGTQVASHSADGTLIKETNWTTYTYDFVAASDLTKIAFADGSAADGLGTFIDNISLELMDCVPLPPVCEAGIVFTDDFENPVVENLKNWDIFTDTSIWMMAWMHPNEVTPSLELHNGVSDWTAHSGQYAELDGDLYGPDVADTGLEQASVKIYKDIDTFVDAFYVLDFFFSPRPEEAIEENKVEVYINGVKEYEYSEAGGDDTNWTPHQVTFTATSESTTIEFRDAGVANARGTFIDDVSLELMYCEKEEEEEDEDVYGCTDETAINYDQEANMDDGSCNYCGNLVKDEGEDCDSGEMNGTVGYCNADCSDWIHKGSSDGERRSYLPLKTSQFDSDDSEEELPEVPEEVLVLGEEGVAQLLMTKTIDREWANPGDTANYTIKIENIGNLEGFNLNLVNTLPAEFVYDGTEDTEKSWAIGDLPSGESREISYIIKVKDDTLEKTYTDKAVLTADNHEDLFADADLRVVVPIVLAETGISYLELILLLLVSTTSMFGARVLKRKEI